jgi:hypothetical protein
MAKKNSGVHTIDQILNGVERLFLQIIIGLVAPVLFLLIGWWGSIPFVPEESIKYFALGGLLTGLFIDILFLRRWVRKAYTLPVAWFVLIYLFYSVCLLGFFMGVPLLNLVMGPLGGYYVGLCLRHQNQDKEAVNRSAKRTALFAAAVMAVICAASWTIAYLDTSLAANIQGLFHLEHTLERGTILGLAIPAGIVLVGLEYLLARGFVKFARFM